MNNCQNFTGYLVTAICPAFSLVVTAPRLISRWLSVSKLQSRWSSLQASSGAPSLGGGNVQNLSGSGILLQM